MSHHSKETTNMLLSIITPVYNTSEYLRFSIDSCLEQGVSMDDYEIIFIDDGSTDESASILDEYASKYPNLTVVHKENEGVSVARNVALDLARGEYIWFIDSDDFIEKNVFPDIFELLRTQKPEQLQLNMYHMKSDYFTPEEEALFQAKKLVPGKRLICSSVYRAECINKNNTRFHPELRANGDLVFTYELKKSIGGYTNIATYDPIVYYYRKNGGSITYTISTKKLRSFISLSAIMYQHFLDDHDGFAAYAMVKYLYRSFHGISQLPRAERKEWLRLMQEKKVYPVIVPSDGSAYYRAHYKTMGIRGIHKLMFRWIPTPIGYSYVMLRSFLSKTIQRIRTSPNRQK